MNATRARLADGRWHFQHGPIDIVAHAEGVQADVALAHEAAWRRFTSILDELVGELPELKRPVGRETVLQGLVARRMWRACRPFRDRYITSMAAVAGAVADELIASYKREGIARAWVNNGGDIALHLAPGTETSIGVFADLASFDVAQWTGAVRTDGSFVIAHDMPVRGVATSGWRGRSFSLGIADSVTVLARTAAEADAAATMIANAVDVDDARIVRRPASAMKDDSDLGDMPVTVDVPELGAAAVHRALQAGSARANTLRSQRLIEACVLVCQGQVSVVPSAWHANSFNALAMSVAA